MKTNLTKKQQIIKLSEKLFSNVHDICLNHCPAKNNYGHPLPKLMPYEKNKWTSKEEKAEARCCNHCCANYLNEKEQEDAKKINILPTKYGYYEPGKGCRLPRSHRPIFCLTFACSFLYKEIQKDKKQKTIYLKLIS